MLFGSSVDRVITYLTTHSACRVLEQSAGSQSECRCERDAHPRRRNCRKSIDGLPPLLLLLHMMSLSINTSCVVLLLLLQRCTVHSTVYPPSVYISLNITTKLKTRTRWPIKTLDMLYGRQNAHAAFASSSFCFSIRHLLNGNSGRARLTR